jgi:hypothetical protein
MVETGLGVKGNVTAGYCGRDKGPQYGGLNVCTAGCVEDFARSYDGGRTENGGNLNKGSR